MIVENKIIQTNKTSTLDTLDSSNNIEESTPFLEQNSTNTVAQTINPADLIKVKKTLQSKQDYLEILTTPQIIILHDRANPSVKSVKQMLMQLNENKKYDLVFEPVVLNTATENEIKKFSKTEDLNNSKFVYNYFSPKISCDMRRISDVYFGRVLFSPELKISSNVCLSIKIKPVDNKTIIHNIIFENEPKRELWIDAVRQHFSIVQKRNVVNSNNPVDVFVEYK